MYPSVHIKPTYKNKAEKAAKKATDLEYLDPKIAAMMKVLYLKMVRYSITDLRNDDRWKTCYVGRLHFK